MKPQFEATEQHSSEQHSSEEGTFPVEECKARQLVTPAWGAPTSSGHVCLAIGSRCEPSKKCARREKQYVDWLEEDAAVKKELEHLARMRRQFLGGKRSK